MTTWTQFCTFLTTTYLNVDIFNLEYGQKLAFLDHLPPLFVHVVIECPQRSKVFNTLRAGNLAHAKVKREIWEIDKFALPLKLNSQGKFLF